ncbi:MAG: nuclease-related domain-containing protein [Solirubrobacterales bacterium]
MGREYQRRRHNRETRILNVHPWVGPLLLALRGAPQHEQAFRLGELGERAVAASLGRLTEGSAVLHDRRMPGGYGNIDHLAIVRSGVFVIDAKGCRGKVKVITPLFGPQRLLVAGRERTKFVDGLDRQVAAVREALAAGGHPGVPVQGVLCFTIADLPFFGTLKIRGHLLLHRRSLLKRLRGEGPLGSHAIEVLAHTLASALPSA